VTVGVAREEAEEEVVAGVVVVAAVVAEVAVAAVVERAAGEERPGLAKVVVGIRPGADRPAASWPGRQSAKQSIDWRRR
jgi:hypothetical protein